LSGEKRKGLLNREFARTLLSWRHSGFSIDSGTRIYDTEARHGLCQYILRAPLAMQKLEWDEEQDTVTWNSSPTGYFQGKQVHFSCIDFIAQVTLHIPPQGKHLLRRYGLYASLGRQLFAKQTARGQSTGHLEQAPRHEQPPYAGSGETPLSAT
jgi:hypothetical protein